MRCARSPTTFTAERPPPPASQIGAQRAMQYGDPDGHGRYGILDVTADGLLCHECGWRGAHLGLHSWKAHGITASAYRERHGLRRSKGLVAADLHQKMSAGSAERLPAAWSRPEILNAPPQSGSPRSALSAQRPQPTATAAWPSSHEPPAKAPWSSAKSAKWRSAHSEPPPGDASVHDPAPSNTGIAPRENAEASSRPGPRTASHSMHIRCNPSKRKAPDRRFRWSGALSDGGRYWV